ncbi:MAG TPA: YbhB/YbcL family Raf kinase inhibitor-like protein [Candidatus Nanoarchaeia archaeon]
MKITSPVFANNASIPSKYTCDGSNFSPPLQFSDVPTQAKSLVLICDDPDAPGRVFVHWTIWNINPETSEIGEGKVPDGTTQGVTDFGEVGYGGPCPPSGTHRYFFKLYALDIILELPYSAGKEDVEKAMDGHIVAQAELVGNYSKGR